MRKVAQTEIVRLKWDGNNEEGGSNRNCEAYGRNFVCTFLSCFSRHSL
jgi:hypothetical protein